MACHFFRHRQRFLIRALGGSHRRQTHDVTGLDTRVGLRPALVDAHFAAANDAVNVGFGHALELPDQKVVEPLTGVVFIDGDQRSLRQHGGCVGRAARVWQTCPCRRPGT